ncbi:aminomethyltransferase family protein [Salinilacihabitans rarus]|uniref:CAF17-like 4Fe-4S cluster assembly/insertion protein YgfZ n=1 Tax=Salinilacihabitans rarus TaxID=2961596 RepID=UPI0020C84D58|nr:aminomethyltransferase family protein [Salinilacihabitans rarus]
MSVIESAHEDLGATFGERAGRRVVDHYGRPERAHRAVRNAVGLFEPAYGVVVVEGDDRVEYVDNVVTNRVPSEDGEGCYALVLDPQGRIEHELYVYNAGERLLLFTAPDRAGALAADWSGKVFIQDVEIREATDEFAVFGVHGPTATEKVASVLGGAASPDRRLSFVRGSIGEAGVSVIRTDAPAGEESYEVVCAAADAGTVFDDLLTRGMNAAPFGYRTWDTLTLEAGTPLFATELAGTVPNVLGLRVALDFEKGCYVGQEVVSRVENRGQPSRRLVGLTVEADAVPEDGAAVVAGDATVGEVTRAGTSPIREAPVALALVEFDLADEALAVRVDGAAVPARRTALPFVEGSEPSARLPEYPDA